METIRSEMIFFSKIYQTDVIFKKARINLIESVYDFLLKNIPTVERHTYSYLSRHKMNT